MVETRRRACRGGSWSLRLLSWLVLSRGNFRCTHVAKFSVKNFPSSPSWFPKYRILSYLLRLSFSLPHTLFYFMENVFSSKFEGWFELWDIKYLGTYFKMWPRCDDKGKKGWVVWGRKSRKSREELCRPISHLWMPLLWTLSYLFLRTVQPWSSQ